MKPSDLHQHLASDQEIFLCDVRTKMEFDSIHLTQAKHIPLDAIKGKINEKQFPDDRLIVFICKSGARSEKAVQLLKAAGYNNLDFVEGGTDQCHKEGLDVIEGRKRISLERQVRIAAGTLVLVGVALALSIDILFIVISAFVGAGLVFAGLTDTCGMGLLLAKAPWNK